MCHIFYFQLSEIPQIIFFLFSHFFLLLLPFFYYNFKQVKDNARIARQTWLYRELLLIKLNFRTGVCIHWTGLLD